MDRVTLVELMERDEWSVSDIEAAEATLRLLVDSIGRSQDGPAIVRMLSMTADEVAALLEKKAAGREAALRAPGVQLIFPR